MRLMSQLLMLIALSVCSLLVVHTVIRQQPRQSETHQRNQMKLDGRLGLQQSIDPPCEVTGFLVKDSFSFPQPSVMKSIRDIEDSRSICDLKTYLKNYKSERPIALITSNDKYKDVLLNWLISASVRSGIPLDSILILSLDKGVHTLLLQNRISTVLITPSMLFRQGITFSEPFEAIMMLRLAMMRLINHFGFDVVMYDTDAVILKDPQPLYDELLSEDIIGSVGKIPEDLVAEWGITICIGVVLVRSSQKTEMYWNSMQYVCTDVLDDQGKLNCGLKALDIQWANNNSDYQNTTVYGSCSNGLNVSILQYDYICRQDTCDPSKRASYYIWHKGGQRSRRKKLQGAREGRTWFLKYKWELNRGRETGLEWLESICYPGVTHE